MTKGEINLLHTEIDNLLNDICKFLNEEIRNGFLSPNGRPIADTLIRRSKHQLQVISVTTTHDGSDAINEPYVDMQSYKVNQDQEYPEPQEVYSDVFEGISNPSSADDDQILCPYANLSATEIKDGKTGQLYRKEKIFFFEQQKKVYAAVLQSWLVIYLNENSSKPCQTFDLTHYEARPSTPLKDMKKRDDGFDLFNTNADSKSYHFTALTSKDAMQWIAAINHHNESVVTRRSLPPVPETNIPDTPSSRNSDDNDYEPLNKYQLKQDTNIQSFKSSKTTKKLDEQPLPLPPRNMKPKVVQQAIPRVPSEDSLSSNYDSVGPGIQNPSRNNSNSFSEDDSDTYYDNPTDLKQKIENVEANTKINKNQDSGSDGELLKNVNDEDDEEEVYDFLQNPDPPNAKPINLTNIKSSNIQQMPDEKIKAPKLKPKLKPKILSLRHRLQNNV